jgi:predicted enzyme related to lactoylglutathione lyase
MNLLVNLDVDDLARAEDFYVRGLGLSVGRRFGDSFLELLGASSPIYLLQKAPGTLPFAEAPGRDYARHWTPVHIDFVVDDLDDALRRALEAGAKIEGAVVTRKWGRMANLADPFGHGICLVQFAGRGYDELLPPG